MSNENFTSYTEVDPNSHISRATARVTYTNLASDEDAYAYKDFGANCFNGDFTHLLTIKFDSMSNSSLLSAWTLANLVSDCQDIIDNNGDAFFLACGMSGSNVVLFLEEVDGGTQYDSSSYTISLATIYYLKIVRNESVGTYGTLYLYIYSDAARTNLLSTLSIALHTSKKDFRYAYPIQSWDTGWAGQDHDGYTENFDLGFVVFTPKIFYF